MSENIRHLFSSLGMVSLMWSCCCIGSLIWWVFGVIRAPKPKANFIITCRTYRYTFESFLFWHLLWRLFSQYANLDIFWSQTRQFLFLDCTAWWQANTLQEFHYIGTFYTGIYMWWQYFMYKITYMYTSRQNVMRQISVQKILTSVAMHGQ